MLLPLELWISERTQCNAIYKLFDDYAYWHGEQRVHTKTSDIEKQVRTFGLLHYFCLVLCAAITRHADVCMLGEKASWLDRPIIQAECLCTAGLVSGVAFPCSGAGTS